MVDVDLMKLLRNNCQGKPSFGDLLKEYRIRKGWSQKKLVSNMKSKWTKSTISKWETGASLPDLKTVEFIAVLLFLHHEEELRLVNAWLCDLYKDDIEGLDNINEK